MKKIIEVTSFEVVNESPFMESALQPTSLALRGNRINFRNQLSTKRRFGSMNPLGFVQENATMEKGKKATSLFSKIKKAVIYGAVGWLLLQASIYVFASLVYIKHLGVGAWLEVVLH